MLQRGGWGGRLELYSHRTVGFSEGLRPRQRPRERSRWSMLMPMSRLRGYIPADNVNPVTSNCAKDHPSFLLARLTAVFFICWWRLCCCVTVPRELPHDCPSQFGAPHLIPEGYDTVSASASTSASACLESEQCLSNRVGDEVCRRAGAQLGSGHPVP